MLLVLLVALLTPALQAGAMTPPSLTLQARRTVDLIYNMEFDAALKAAQTVIDMAPDHPAGYFYRAATFWQWRLMARHPQQRAALLAQFQEDIGRTLQVAERLPAARAAEAAFYLGAGYGTQARMHITEKQYFKALRAARKGGAYLQRCVELDPTRHDAYLGLGVYHYFLARVPGFVRGIAQWLVGLDGNRDRGLQELEHARTQSPLAAPEAASMLAKIYASGAEQQYHRARFLLEGLVQQYPNNVDYRYRLLLVLAHLGLWEHARQTSQALVRDIEHGKLPYARPWLLLLHYRIAETYVLQGEHATALPLLSALQAQTLDEALRPWVYLRLGNVYDLRGERQLAYAYYQRVAGHDGVEELAARYVTTPFTPGQSAIKPPEKAI